MHEVRSNTTQSFNANVAGAADPAVAFATVASPNLPGVIYARQSGDVFAEIEGVVPNQLNRCLLGDLSFVSMSNTSMQIEGAWFAGWSVLSSASFGSEGKAVFCADAGCVSEACEAADEEFNFARNPAVATTRRQGDPAGVVFIAAASPIFAVNADDSTDAELRLGILRIDFGENLMNTENAETEVLADISVSRMPTDDALSGPNLPAMSFMPPDKLALAWIEPSSDAPMGALRVQRYQMCLPEAE
jgi:hypothetical protein